MNEIILFSKHRPQRIDEQLILTSTPDNELVVGSSRKNVNLCYHYDLNELDKEHYSSDLKECQSQ